MVWLYSSLCRQIRQQYARSLIQIVLVSAQERYSSLDDLLEVGADDFIGKPITPLELQTRVKAAHIRWSNQHIALSDNRDSVYPSQKIRVSTLLAENTKLRREYDKIRQENKTLQMLASLDTLSGLLNRRSLFERIEVEIERSLRLGLPLAGIMIDIDHFKRVNDNFGHACGDMVIQDIGRRLTQSLRKYDHAGRYGGEEFFVVFPNTTADTALAISERFRKEIEEAPYSWEDHPFALTISIGIAQFTPGESREKWISRADLAMYGAKQNGRNQVVLR